MVYVRMRAHAAYRYTRRSRPLVFNNMFVQTLIVDLTRSLDEPQDSANLQIAVLSFFNAMINYKAGQVSDH